MYLYDDIKLIIDNAREVPLLTAKEEKLLARQIAETRIELWMHTLSYTALCPAMIEFTRPLLMEIVKRGTGRREVDLSALNDLYEHANLERKRKYGNALKEQREKAAKTIADIDRGLEAFGKVNQELRRRKPFYRPTPPSNSSKFSNYLAEIDVKLREHRKLKERFWQANIRLAASLAKKYNHGMIPFADMMQEGLIGLMTAVERFEYERGLRFSTYATWWIRHALNRFHANHGRTVRWPAHIVTDFEHLKQTRNKILRRGEKPTPELLAKESGIRIKRVNRILGLSTIQPISMDAELPGLEGERLVDRIKDDKFSIDDENPRFDPAFRRIEAKIQGLPGIEADVIIKRFGLDGKDPRTLQEIANEHSLSRERIRQLEQQGLGRLREVIRQ